MRFCLFHLWLGWAVLSGHTDTYCAPSGEAWALATAAPVLDSLGEQGEVISRVARTGGSSITGDIEAGAWACHPIDGCTSPPATVSTHSGQSQANASDTPNDAADRLEDGDPAEHSGCSTDDADPSPPLEAHAFVQPPDAPALRRKAK